VYFTMSRKKKTRRRIDPYRVWFHGGTFYLIGFCHLRNEVRVFALDRIKMLYQTDEAFKTPVDFSVEDFMKPSFGVYHGQTVHVMVWFHPDAAGYIREKIWHPSQKIRAGEDGSIIFEADVSGTDEIRFWIMSWGSKAKVLQPESLCLKIREEAEKMAGQYETQGKAGEQTPSGRDRDHPLQRG
ncbi:MAG: WYL domain-containing protein, partial [Deltaproteobacteria bacterium]|nr:WYL domain-containing protein [Deltaproteobacteria bacterium]